MEYKALCFVAFMMMGSFIPPIPVECIPLNNNGTTEDLTQTFARNSTTFIKQGNASEVLEALGLLSAVGKEEDESHNLSTPMEIQINVVSLNMSALQTEASDYDSNQDSDAYGDEQSVEPRSDDYFDHEAALNGGHDSEDDEAQGKERKGSPIDLTALDDLANELATWALCIKIYENHVTNTITKPTNDPKHDDGNDYKPGKVMVDTLRFIGQCKIFFLFMKQTFDKLDVDHQSSEEAQLPDTRFEEMPRSILNTHASETMKYELQQTPATLIPLKSASDVPPSPSVDAVHPHTGFNAEMLKTNVTERRKDSNRDHAKGISVGDETTEDCEEDDDNAKGLFIIIAFYASTLLASFLLGIVFEQYRRDCIQSRDQVYMVPGQTALLKLNKQHEKKIIIKT